MQQTNHLLEMYTLYFPASVIIFLKSAFVIIDKEQKEDHYTENKYIWDRDI